LTPSSFLLAQLHRRDGAMHLLPSLSSVMHCRPVPRALHAKPRICKASLLARCSFPCGLWDVIALTIEMEAKQPCRCREPHSCMPRFIVPKPGYSLGHLGSPWLVAALLAAVALTIASEAIGNHLEPEEAKSSKLLITSCNSLACNCSKKKIPSLQSSAPNELHPAFTNAVAAMKVST